MGNTSGYPLVLISFLLLSMKPKIIITSLLLLAFTYSRATSDFTITWQNGHVMMIGNGYGYEDVFKQEFLLFALDKINKEYFNDTAFISVRMSMDSFRWSAHCALPAAILYRLWQPPIQQL